MGRGIYFLNKEQADSTTTGYKEAVAWVKYVRKENTIAVLECKIEVNKLINLWNNVDDRKLFRKIRDRLLKVYKSKNGNDYNFKEYTIFAELWDMGIELIIAMVDAGKKTNYESKIVDRPQVQIALKSNSYIKNISEVFNG